MYIKHTKNRAKLKHTIDAQNKKSNIIVYYIVNNKMNEITLIINNKS